MNANSDPLFDLLRPERLTSVVDIGANPLDRRRPALQADAATSGCAPWSASSRSPRRWTSCIAQKGDLETYLPYAVGGETQRHCCKVCHAPGMTSLLHAGAAHAGTCFPGFADFGHVLKEVPIETRALDGIAEITHIDHLKIDVQGSELNIFRNGAAGSRTPRRDPD